MKVLAGVLLLLLCGCRDPDQSLIFAERSGENITVHLTFDKSFLIEPWEARQLIFSLQYALNESQ
jgi:hypothetical protein